MTAHPAARPTEEWQDPRYEWTELHTFGGDVRYFKRCLHTEVVEVESGGEVVAQLCLTCDAQLPADLP